MINRVNAGFAVLLGLAALANGAYMITAPESWYGNATGVSSRGPFNQHFVRDIGFIYGLIGAAFLYGTVKSKHRLQLWLLPTAWLVSHAAFHSLEVIVGISEPETLIEDFVGVTMPALTGLGLLFSSYRTRSD